MKATHTDRPQKFTTRHRRELPCHLAQWSAVDLAAEPYPDGTMPEVVTLRTYSAGKRSSTTTAAVWVRGTIQASGTGSTSGWGYHRPSEAAAIAIRNAGFDLSERIDGCGDSAIRAAVLALAIAAGATRPAIVTANA